MIQRPLGQTGLSVSLLGFGAMHVDDLADEAGGGHLLLGRPRVAELQDGIV